MNENYVQHRYRECLGAKVGDALFENRHGAWVRWKDVAPYIMESQKPSYNSVRDAIVLLERVYQDLGCGAVSLRTYNRIVRWRAAQQHP